MRRTSPALFALLGSIAAAADDGGEQETPERTPLQTVVPQYPESALRDRLEGEVQVCYHIDRRGRPYRIAVRQSTHRIFERPSIRAVSASSWAPLAMEHELPASKVCRSFFFRLMPVQEP